MRTGVRLYAPSSFSELLFSCVEDAIEESEIECEKAFKEAFCLKRTDEAQLKKGINEFFCSLRNSFEDDCYHGKNGGDHSLDYRKASAILCSALIHQKSFTFNVSDALKDACNKEHLIQETHGKDRKEFNRYLASNHFINYKVAYLSALHLLYYFMFYEAVNKNWTDKDGHLVWKKLSSKKGLIQYISSEEEDSFDVNMIIGLARSDMYGKDLDLYFLSLQFYQIEMYTRLSLTHNAYT